MNTLNCIEKTFTFSFEEQKFTVDLTEADLHDNWNSIQTKDRVLDFNFSWQEEEEPNVTLYELEVDGLGNLSILYHPSHNLPIENIIGTEDEYFKEVIKESYRIKFLGYIDVEADSLEMAQEVVQTMGVDFNEVYVETLI